MKKEIKDELKSIAPRLAEFRKSRKDELVSEDYFSGMQDEVLQKVESRKPVLRRILLPLMTAAAIVTIGFFVFSGPQTFNKSKNLSWEQITESEMEEYLLANVEDFEYSLMAELTNNIDLDIELYDEEILKEYIIDNIDKEMIEEEILENYLNKEL